MSIQACTAGMVAVALICSAQPTPNPDRERRKALAIAEYKNNDYLNAASELRALYREKPEPEIAALLGDCLLLSGRYSDALDVLEPVAKTNPQNSEVAFLLGSALIHLDKPVDGVKLVEKAAKTGRNADAWMLAGMTYLKLGNYAQARDCLDSALRLNPALPGAYTLSGVAKSIGGDEEGAKAAFRKALNLDANDFLANLRLATLLYKQRDLDGAKPLLEHAVKLDAASVPAQYAMSLLEMAEGRDQAATSRLEGVVKVAPNLLAAHVKLAALYYRLNRQDDGMRERQIVDRLMADPSRLDPRLDEDPALRIEQTGSRAPSP